MANLSEEITRLQTAKTDIKAAIEGKGVAVGNELISGYAAKIESISSLNLPPTPTVSRWGFWSLSWSEISGFHWHNCFENNYKLRLISQKPPIDYSTGKYIFPETYEREVPILPSIDSSIAYWWIWEPESSRSVRRVNGSGNVSDDSLPTTMYSLEGGKGNNLLHEFAVPEANMTTFSPTENRMITVGGKEYWLTYLGTN